MLRWAGQSSMGWVLAGQVVLQLDSGDIVDAGQEPLMDQRQLAAVGAGGQ